MEIGLFVGWKLDCLLDGNRTKRNALKVLKTLLDARKSFFVFLVDGSCLCFDLDI